MRGVPAGAAPGAAAEVWRVIKTAVASDEGRDDKCPALAACRAAATCAAKEADAELARDVDDAARESKDAATASDLAVVVAVVAALALADDAEGAAKAASRRGDADAAATGAAMAATAKAGARAAVVAAYRSADTIGLVVDDKACDAVAAACESAATEKEKEAGRALLAEWRERGVVGADAAERRVVDAATRGDAGKTAERPPGKSAVKAGASFASAAGGGRARDARTSAEEGKLSEAPAKEKKGKGKGGPGKGGDAGGGKTKGAGASGGGGGGGAPKGWGKPATASTTPLVAASAPFTPAAARKAAPFVPASKAAVNGVAAAAAKLSVSAPAFVPKTPSADAPAFVPRFKQTTPDAAEPPAAPAPTKEN